MDDEKKLTYLFEEYDKKYFSQALKNVKVLWSDRMTLCTGKTYLGQRNNNKFCNIRLSKPLLNQRPFEDTINTLLHEMIHAYLFLTKGKGLAEGHGKHFQDLMKKINNLEGSRIRIRHTFLKEVNKFRVNIYKCDGPCRHRKPFYGVIRRAIPRPPGPVDKWWSKHSAECGGTFHKVDDGSKELNETVERCQSATRPSQRKTLLITKPSMSFRNGSLAGEYKLVKANINPSYVSEIRRINIRKYINKYLEYNKGSLPKQKVENNLPLSIFRQHLDSNIEKYIAKARHSLKYTK